MKKLLLLILLTIPMLNCGLLDCDYTTSQGICIIQGSVNRPEPMDIEDSVSIVYQKFQRSNFFDHIAIKAAFATAVVEFKDWEFLYIGANPVKGFTLGNYSEVAYLDGHPGHIQQIFRHELGHIILTYQGVPLLQQEAELSAMGL